MSFQSVFCFGSGSGWGCGFGFCFFGDGDLSRGGFGVGFDGGFKN